MHPCTCCVQQCEDLEDTPSLVHIFRIARGAIMLNDASLLEELLKVCMSAHGQAMRQGAAQTSGQQAVGSGQRAACTAGQGAVGQGAVAGCRAGRAAAGHACWPAALSCTRGPTRPYCCGSSRSTGQNSGFKP